MIIRDLREADAEAYFALRRASLADAPLAFAASPEDDIASSPEAIREQLRRGPEAAVVGAFDEHLIGALGLGRDRHIKAAHKVHFWGMYVAPTHRQRGVGAALLHEAIRRARALPGVSCIHLSVSSAAPAARRLYERAGFEVWGSEPDALRHGGESAVEDHMVLKIR